MSYLEGHRQRLRDRFNGSGLSAFEDHEVLELLLIYAVPRKDVKPATPHKGDPENFRLQELLDQVRALAAAKARTTLRSGSADGALDDLLGGADVDDLDDLPEIERWDVEDSLVERLTNAESIGELEAEVHALERLLRQARSALGSGIVAKLIQLTDAILRDEGLAARGEKLLIFTEAKDTLTFLVEQLRAQGFIVAVIEGSLSMDQRRQQQELFRGEAQIMVATEAGGESINLQFCNQMVNYDIPWNPNRLEQRMGRIHRIGQQNEVFIFNLVTTDTREEGLARRFVNLPELRIDAMRSAGQALLPSHLEQFFTRTLERNRGRWERRADGKLRVERVPVNLRHEQEIDFRRRHGTVNRAYLSLTFDKAEVGEDGRTELLGPGHPLFESVLKAAETGFTHALARGAVFFDVDAHGPERLWFFRGVVGDGTGRVLSQRLLACRAHRGQGPGRAQLVVRLLPRRVRGRGCLARGPLRQSTDRRGIGGARLPGHQGSVPDEPAQMPCFLRNL